LNRPFSRWMRGDVEMENSSGAYLHGYKNVQDPESRCHGDEEITGDDRLCMILDEGLPTLVRGATRPIHVQVFRNRSRRHANMQFQHQFIGDSLLAPRRILLIHLSNQCPDILRQGRAREGAKSAKKSPK